MNTTKAQWCVTPKHENRCVITPQHIEGLQVGRHTSHVHG